jgi:hypothetical protein
MNNPLIDALNAERNRRAEATQAAEPRICPSCGSPDTAWRSDPSTSETGPADPEMDSDAAEAQIASAVAQAVAKVRADATNSTAVNLLTDALTQARKQ